MPKFLFLLTNGLLGFTNNSIIIGPQSLIIQKSMDQIQYHRSYAPQSSIIQKNKDPIQYHKHYRPQSKGIFGRLR